MTIQKKSAEPIIEPDLPIVDSHHHLWFVPAAAREAMQPGDNPFLHVRRNTPRYLLDELLADIDTGHNVRATVFAEAHAMYRPSGPEAMKSLGEVEFAAGVAAMAASGVFGSAKICA